MANFKLNKPKILAVDDEEFNLDIMCEYLSKAGFDVISANDGDVALKKMEEHENISVVILDRMMPRMNGLEVLETIKQDDRYKHIPVIMQTAAAQSEQVIEGFDLGVYYYLAKPYEEQLLVSIVKAAYDETMNLKNRGIEAQKSNDISPLLKSGKFNFNTILEAQFLGAFLGNCYSEPEEATLSLISLLTNAVYANLDISYTEKTELLMTKKLDDEVERLLKRADYKHKRASVSIEIYPDEIIATIKDQGSGFDWEKHSQLNSETADTPKGRGSVKAVSYFSKIQYLGNGNEVICTKQLNEQHS